MILAVSATENNGDSPWARSHAFTLASPAFEPFFANFKKCASIGSGRSPALDVLGWHLVCWVLVHA